MKSKRVSENIRHEKSVESIPLYHVSGITEIQV